MQSKRPVSLLLLLVLVPGILVAQHAGGGQQRQGQTAASSGSRQMQNEQQRTAITDQQRNQYKSCDRTLEKLRNRTRDMASATAAKSINLDAVRHNQSQVREQFRSVEEDRTQLSRGLNQEQQSAVQPHALQLDRLRDRIQTHLNTIDQTMGAPSLDRHRLTEEARLTERAVRAYQMHFHEMGEALGVSLD